MQFKKSHEDIEEFEYLIQQSDAGDFIASSLLFEFYAFGDEGFGFKDDSEKAISYLIKMSSQMESDDDFKQLEPDTMYKVALLIRSFDNMK